MYLLTVRFFCATRWNWVNVRIVANTPEPTDEWLSEVLSEYRYSPHMYTFDRLFRILSAVELKLGLLDD